MYTIPDPFGQNAELLCHYCSDLCYLSWICYLNSSSICIMFYFFRNCNRYLTVKLFLTSLKCTWSRTPCTSSRTPLTFSLLQSRKTVLVFTCMPSRTPCTSSRTPCTSSRTPSVFTGFNCLRTRIRLSKDEIWNPQDSTVGMSKK